MARNCIADMPEDVKCKILDHALYIAEGDPDVTASVSFLFVADRDDDSPSASVMYSSGKHGKRKLGRPCKWIGERGEGKCAW